LSYSNNIDNLLGIHLTIIGVRICQTDIATRRMWQPVQQS